VPGRSLKIPPEKSLNELVAPAWAKEKIRSAGDGSAGNLWPPYGRGRPREPDDPGALESNALMTVRNFLMLRLFWCNIMADVSSAHPENYVFRDIGGVVGHALQIAGD
jgi:hypothetical protein